MTDQIQHKLIGAGVILGVVIIALAFYSWLGDHDARIQLKATVDAQSQVIAKLNDSIKERDAQAVQDKAELDKKLTAAKTPDQQAALLSVLAGLKQPLTINVPPTPVPGSKEPPQAPSATLSAPQIADLNQFAVSCKKCEVDRDALTGDVKDLKEKIKATEVERDAAVTAVKGGTKWQRFRRSAKTLGIGLAFGAALGFAAHR
jgi:hypothetical protein